MKVVLESKQIPAKTILVEKYISNDGQEFSSKIECEQHEKKLEIAKHPVIASRIENVSTFYDDFNATMYYISSEDDLDFLRENWVIWGFDTDFDKYGPGWYIYHSESGGDWPDSQSLYNYDNYEKEMEEELKKWKQSIRSKIGTQEG